MGTWVVVTAITAPWRGVTLYENRWSCIPAVVLFCGGLVLYKLSCADFNLGQLGGLPEVLPDQSQQRLAITGIRGRIRHPIYLGHLLEMLAWSAGTGLVVCWALTGFAVATGMVMIRMEDAELEKRFGEEYVAYRNRVPAVLPNFFP